jgi:hypothetical protein
MQRSRRILVPLLLAALVGAPAALAPAGPSAAVTSAAQAAKPFRLDLADRNDFVAQTNFVQCVGASMQIMLNIMGDSDRTSRTQVRLQTIARTLSGPTRTGFTRQGASIRGWTAGLNLLDAGPYRLVGADTLQEALRLAARSIRETGKPVGLLVWSGRHAWVMSGFQATADPRRTNDFQVTKAVIIDPLYPYGSSTWGPSPKPRATISTATVGKQFVPRGRGTWAGAPAGANAGSLSALSGKYVIVMPYNPIVFVRNKHVAA